MTLASRARSPSAAQAVIPARGGRGSTTESRAVGGRGNARPANAAQPFQSLDLLADQAGLARQPDAGDAPDQAAQLLLPPGFSPDLPTESVTSFGNAGQLNVYYEVYDPSQTPEGSGRQITLLTNIAFFRGGVRVYETPLVEATELTMPDRKTSVFQFDVPASSLQPGFYICR